MMHVVHANRIEDLAERLAAALRDDPVSEDPFVPERVLVQSPGMGRWLALRVADALGITANVRFEAPLRFLYETAYRAVLGEDAVPGESSFRRDVLVWRLLRAFDEVRGAVGFEPLTRYLDATEARERHQLAGRVADAYDRYQVWRPDWILAWERGETKLDGSAHEGWQAALWRRLVETGPDPARPDHRAAVQARYRVGLAADPEAARARLPRRVVVVGGAALPREAFDDVLLLSRAIDVLVLFPNPCEHDWTSIESRKQIARIAAREGRDPDDLHLFDGHPLLASMGRDGQAFLARLLDAEGEGAEIVHDVAFVDPVEQARSAGREPTLLDVLQRDVLRLEATSAENLPREPGSPRHRSKDDPPPRSIQIHACHTPTRELQVLHDRLLELFDRDPTLTASDVVAMVPDVDAYAPHVDAVFGAAPPERRVPYTIADRGSLDARPTVDAFVRLLDLPAGRLEVGPMLDLLDVPSVRARFALDESDVARMRAWTRDAGVRWGIDRTWREHHGAPAFDGFGWGDGLDRMMRAFAIGDGFAPVTSLGEPAVLEGDDARILGGLWTFAHEVFEAAARLAAPTAPAAWGAILRDLLDRFVRPTTPEDDAQRADLEAAIDGMVEDAAEAGFDAPVDRTVVRAELVARVGAGGGGRFLAGGVTFCRTTPLRAVPFRVVALVGMNTDAFPRPERAPDFDLLDRARRRGDPSRREEDRYLFLEAVLSAREHLIVTYVGRGVRDDRESPPSVVVEELREALHGAVPTTVHPLQPFSTRYREVPGAGAEPDDRFTYRPAPVPTLDGRVGPLVGAPLPLPDGPPESVDLDDLVAFVRDPSRWFVERRLGMRLRRDDDWPDPREPFVLGNLERYRVDDRLIAARGEGEDAATARAAARATGVLPAGTPGVLVLDERLTEADAYVARHRAEAGGAVASAVDVRIELDGVEVVGRVAGIHGDRLVLGRPSKLKAKDRLETWVRQLALCAVADGDRGPAAYVGIDRTQRYAALEPEAARERLADLVALYREAHQEPVPLFPASSWAYVHASRSKRVTKPPDVKARDAFDAESEDEHVAALYRDRDPLDDRFRELAERVFAPLVDDGEAGA